MVEDETDVQAAKELKEEVNANNAEFDENIDPNQEQDGEKLEKFNRRGIDERLENEFKSIETEVNFLHLNI